MRTSLPLLGLELGPAAARTSLTSYERGSRLASDTYAVEMRQRRLLVMVVWAALILSGCAVTFRLGVEPVLLPRTESWITGAELRDRLNPLGYTFRFDGARWKGGRADLPYPLDAIQIEERDGPAQVRVYLSVEEQGSLTAALDVARMLGVDGGVTERVTYDFNVGLGGAGCYEDYLTAGHAGTLYVFGLADYFAQIDFTPTDVHRRTEDYGCVGYASPSSMASPQLYLRVPNLRYQREAEAVESLLRGGLAPGSVPEVHDSSVPAGLVAATDPATGSAVLAGDRIDIVVSLGPELTPEPPAEPTKVPDLRGYQEETALNWLSYAHLRPGARFEAHDPKVVAGRVIYTYPAAGSVVDFGATIDYVVSLGRQPLLVPSPAPPSTPVASIAPTTPPVPTVGPPAATPMTQPLAAPAGDGTTATITTALGDIVIELYTESAPVAARNFEGLAQAGFYDGTTFHRLVPDFVIQGGDPDGTGSGGPGYTIPDEDVVGEYGRGIVAMARTPQPDSQGSQFFIVLDDLARPALEQYRTYVIFGEVTSGMDVVDAIAGTPNSGPPDNTAIDPVVMESVTIQGPSPSGAPAASSASPTPPPASPAAPS
jgi:peptidylprolyl isomerase